MFKILCLLRDLNALRAVHWYVASNNEELVVRIPLSEEDAKLVEDMQRLFAPAD